MISIKDFDSGLLKIDKKWYKSIGIYNTGYITIKAFEDYENTNSINLLYLIICKADGYIEESNRSKYLVFTSTDGNKKVLKKKKHWDEIKHLIETINGGKKGEYEKDFIKIKFNSDHD